MTEILKQLPGSEYATVALPLDYPPSRKYQARWGFTKPPIESLMAWFRNDAPKYKAFLAKMRDEVEYMRDIDIDFTSQRLPSPGWFDVPYAPFDSLALHAMIGTLKPARYLEIGSGATTCFARHAISAHSLPTTITSIDPEPRAAIDAICDTVIRAGLETCDLSIFDSLDRGDILFFDGSHRSFMNSDVTVFFIDVLPRLKPGVAVHIHDITLPWDYDGWSHNWYWNEQYMLAVYLMGNMKKIDMMLPTCFVTRELGHLIKTPFIDFGDKNSYWNGGGAIWFTHR